MRAKEKILTILIGTTWLLAILIPVKSNAALQANGSGNSTKNLEQWISTVRYMESQGETLGLTGDVSLNQQLGEDGKIAISNNLDIHMQKNTEYGAMTILSASNYGKSTPVHVTDNGSLATTTGNKSGVYMSINKEWVAAGTRISDSTIYKNADIKYKNVYARNSDKGITGDATLECRNWHGSSNLRMPDTDYGSGLLRAYAGSIFSYYGGDNSTANHHYGAHFSVSYVSRAVVVIGERILIVCYLDSLTNINKKGGKFK